MLSATAEYALRAVVHLARNGSGEPMQAQALSDATDVPLSYMRKILHELVRAGVLESTRGTRGGFQLAVEPARLTLLEIVSRFDRIGPGRRCLLGRPECTDSNPCPVHDRWKSTAEGIAHFFSKTTVGDVLGKGKPRGK